MASNPFDQFDAPAQQAAAPAANPFDQFDAPAQAPAQQPGLIDRTVALANFTQPVATPIAEAGMHFATSGLAAPIAGLAGIAGSILPGPRGQGANWTEGVQQALTYQPRSQGGQAVQKIGSFLPGLISKGADVAGQGAADATGSPAVGAAVNTGVQMLPALLLRGRAGKVVENVNRSPPAPARAAGPAAATEEAATAAKRPAGLAGVSEAAPSVEQLKADASAAYKRAEDAGVRISEFSLKKLKGKILNELGERVDPTLHPDTTAALKRIADTKGEISLEKLDQLRQIANDAKGSAKPADQRLAGKIVDSIDEYIDHLGPKDITKGDPAGTKALVEARELYTRQKKGEQLDQMFEDAKTKAGANYSQSGLENALRGEFKALALNKKKLAKFTPEEQAAIKRVATDGRLLRTLGKLAPVGGMSQGLSLIAASVQPVTLLASLGSLVAREAATRATLSRANAASELVRRGPNRLAESEPAQPKRVNALLEN
jgi:hypothetical protein